MNEVIYLNDGNVASGQLTDKIKFMWHGGVNEASWEKSLVMRRMEEMTSQECFSCTGTQENK